MSPYFGKFQKTTYDMFGDGTNINVITDIIHRAKFLDTVRDNILIFYPYQVKDGETPEIIAAKLYGSPYYNWIVLFANDIFDLWNDWPLDYFQFEAYLTKKYGSIETAQTTIDHYEAANGDWIDLDTYNATTSEGSQRIYAYDYEVTLNDAKKNIQLLDPTYVQQVDSELNSLLQ